MATLTSTRAASAKAKKKAGRPKASEQDDKQDQQETKNTKSPKDGKKKREWKETVLRKGWLAFRAEYVKAHKNGGKTAKELNQEAGQERGT